MTWLKQVVDQIEVAHPKGEIIVESGGSPSGAYHIGHLREIIISDAILQELKKRGREGRHVHFVDDMDALRKVPVNVPESFKNYLGQPLYIVPSPGNSSESYADYFLNRFLETANLLGIKMDVVRNHKEYRNGDFTEAFEETLEQITEVKKILESTAGRQLDPDWSPIQVMEEEYLKRRKYLGIDKNSKTLQYEDSDGQPQTISYANGAVKLDWRVYWPARWKLTGVNVEPFGRDHATKGGSYDTGAALSKKIFGNNPPIPVPYDFVNLAGDTKKMSASKGTGIDADEVLRVLPPEIVRFFMLQYPPSKRLYFDPLHISKLIDEFSERMLKNPDDKTLLFSRMGIRNLVISSVPFTLLTESYQAALKEPQKTLDVLARTEYKAAVEAEREVIMKELKFIDNWLAKWAPEEVKFELLPQINPSEFNQTEKDYLNSLSQKIAQAPADADGDWFHKAVYEFKESRSMTPEQVFKPLYRALIGQDSGPRAGWFLSILPRDWLIKRLKLEA